MTPWRFVAVGYAVHVLLWSQSPARAGVALALMVAVGAVWHRAFVMIRLLIPARSARVPSVPVGTGGAR